MRQKILLREVGLRDGLPRNDQSSAGRAATV